MLKIVRLTALAVLTIVFARLIVLSVSFSIATYCTRKNTNKKTSSLETDGIRYSTQSTTCVPSLIIRMGPKNKKLQESAVVRVCYVG